MKTSRVSPAASFPTVATSCLLLALFFPVFLAAQPRPSVDKNPLSSAEDLAAGEAIYRQHCSSCHGEYGEGGRGSRLNTGQFRHGETDVELFYIISRGIPGTGMPWSFFDAPQLWQVLAYVRSLGANAPKEDVPGDTTKGREIFAGKGNCLGCHMVGVEGGRMGPSLTEIGAVRSADHLRVSLLHPSAEVTPTYYGVKAVKAGGAVVTGRRMNEDTYSIQLIDPRENLVSLHKEELRELEVRTTSSMPSYRGVLSDEELDDLVAYLTTLRGER